MPGIFGYFDPKQRVPRGTLARMAQSLLHDSAYRVDLLERPWAGIGAVGHNGFPGNSTVHETGSGRYFVLAGELLAMRPTDQSESDSIGLAKGVFGGALSETRLEKLRGSYAVAVLDESSSSLEVVTDHFGLMPVYWARSGDIVLFASEQKALFASRLVAFELDRIALAALLSIGEVFGDRTLVRGIETLPAGAWLRVRDEDLRLRRYWRYSYCEDKKRSWSEAVEETGTALANAVTRALRAKTTVAVPLSGGLDSRFLASLASDRSEVHTYSWGVAGCRDLRYAAQVARALGTAHSSFIFDPTYPQHLAADGVWCTEGLASITNFHVLPFVERLSAREILALDGFAGDVVLGGNFVGSAWTQAEDFHEAGAALWRWRVKSWWGGASSRLRNAAVPSADEARAEFIALYESYAGTSSMDRAMAFLIDNRLRRSTIFGAALLRTRLATQQPFLDVDFTNVIRTLPHPWRRHHRFYLAVLRSSATRVSRCRWQRTMLPPACPYAATWASLAGQRALATTARRLRLPDPFPRRSPSCFSAWFREPLAKWVESLLLDKRTLDRGWIPSGALREAVNGHLGNRFDVAPFLGSALATEIFARRFLDYPEDGSAASPIGSTSSSRLS